MCSRLKRPLIFAKFDKSSALAPMGRVSVSRARALAPSRRLEVAEYQPKLEIEAVMRCVGLAPGTRLSVRLNEVDVRATKGLRQLIERDDCGVTLSLFQSAQVLLGEA